MQEKAEYTRAIKGKYPEQLVVAIARDASGKDNPIAIGWTMITSGDPPMMALSLGRGRHSLKAIRHSGEFVIAFPSREMDGDVLYYGSHSGADTDKLADRSALTEPATEVSTVLLSGAVANFECKVEHDIETGDHVLIVGRIVASHANVDPEVKRLYTIGAGHALGGVEPT